MLWCKVLVSSDYRKYKHPRTGARGRFGAPHARTLRWGAKRPTSRGVLGWHPLMPVLLRGVLVVSSPEIGPEQDRLGLGRPALDDDATGLRLRHERETGHGLAPHTREKDLPVA